MTDGVTWKGACIGPLQKKFDVVTGSGEGWGCGAPCVCAVRRSRPGCGREVPLMGSYARS